MNLDYNTFIERLDNIEKDLDDASSVGGDYTTFLRWLNNYRALTQEEVNDKMFKVGNRVKLTEGNRYAHQSEGRNGTILSIYPVGDQDTLSIRIEWDNGHVNTYYNSDIVSVEEPFKVGGMVKLKQDSSYIDQSKGNIGMIKVNDDLTSDWVKVEWSHGFSDNYPAKDLVHAEEADDSDIEEPLQIGDKVGLVGGSRFKRQEDGIGIITDIRDEGSSGFPIMVKWENRTSYGYPTNEVYKYSDKVGDSMLLIPGQVLILEDGSSGVVIPTQQQIKDTFEDTIIRKQTFNKPQVRVAMIGKGIEIRTLYIYKIKEVTEAYIDVRIYKTGGMRVFDIPGIYTSADLETSMINGLAIEYIGTFTAEKGLEISDFIKNT